METTINNKVQKIPKLNRKKSKLTAEKMLTSFSLQDSNFLQVADLQYIQKGKTKRLQNSALKMVEAKDLAASKSSQETVRI